jgi:hypothetical protein
VRGYKIALIVLALALLAPTVSARFEGVRGPGMSYGGAIGGERFDDVHGPMIKYDGYLGGRAYFSGLNNWVFIGGETEPQPNFKEIVKAYQEQFNLARSVFDIIP